MEAKIVLPFCLFGGANGDPQPINSKSRPALFTVEEWI
jgi:hypothetical protein